MTKSSPGAGSLHISIIYGWKIHLQPLILSFYVADDDDAAAGADVVFVVRWLFLCSLFYCFFLYAVCWGEFGWQFCNFLAGLDGILRRKALGRRTTMKGKKFPNYFQLFLFMYWIVVFLVFPGRFTTWNIMEFAVILLHNTENWIELNTIQYNRSCLGNND